MIKFIELTTERLLLKKFKYDDFVKVWSVDYRYYHMLPGLAFQDKPLDENEWIHLKHYGNNGDLNYENDNIKKGIIEWLIYKKATGEVIGTVIAELDNDKCTNLSYMFLRSYWGNGYATESILKVIDYLFSNDIISIQLIVSKTNERSIRLIERLGFHYDGYEEEKCLFNDGKNKIYGPQFNYSLMNPLIKTK